MTRRPDDRRHTGTDAYAPSGDVHDPDGGSGPDDAAHGPLPTGRPFPWPPARGESPAAAFGETWKRASLTPREFFRAMPATGTIRTALFYYLPLGIAVSGANLFWALTLAGADAEREAVLGEVPLGGTLSPVQEFLFAPLILLASLFIAAGVTHGLLALFGGATRPFAFTTRVLAFSYSPQILAILPVIGTVVGFVWMVVLAIVGLKEGHRASTGRVLAAVLIPVVIALLFMAVAAYIATTGRLLSH